MFRNVEPGIYRFQVVGVTEGGIQAPRMSAVLTIVSALCYDPLKPPPNCIHVLESWPQSLPLVEWLLKAPADVLDALRARFPVISPHLSVCDSQLCASIQWRASLNAPLVQDKIPVNSPVADKLARVDIGEWKRRMRNDPFNPEYDANLLMLRQEWLAEFLDPSEPRSVALRARLMETITTPAQVLATIGKAHERAPFLSKFAADYGCDCYRMGYVGFARFYLDAAYASSPTNPVIAAMKLQLDQACGVTRPSATDIEAGLASEHREEFRAISRYYAAQNRFPESYFAAAQEPFGNDRTKGDAWSAQRF